MPSPQELTTYTLPHTAQQLQPHNQSQRQDRGFDHGHRDLVLAANFNLYGTRLATASADHTLRVWDKKKRKRVRAEHDADEPHVRADGAQQGDELHEWVLTDAWRAHDGEILDVKWTSPLLGAHLGSISTDTTFKLWSEDATCAPGSGRRFTHTSTLPSKSELPHAGLAFRCATAPAADALLALVTMSGNLAVLEARDSGRLSAGEWVDWTGGRDLHVAQPVPGRGEETGFAVAWHDETVPCWSAVAAGLERRSAGLAVAAMDAVKVFRCLPERRIALVAEVRLPALVRSVDWANGAVRGWDVLAAAGKDGVARVLELRSDVGAGSMGGGTARGSGSSSVPETERAGRSVPSGIGAGLAGLSSREEVVVERGGGFKQSISVGAELRGHRGSVWKVGFSFAGDVLTTTGDDGSIRFWSRDLDGEWTERCEVEVKSPPQNSITQQPVEDE